jgi:hypothetical protein
MRHAPHGILRILRSAKSSNSRFTASLLAFLTGRRSCSIQYLLKYNLFSPFEVIKIAVNANSIYFQY